jgi:uncharacterized protein YycO
MVKVHFCRSRNIGGLFIQLVTFSRWNHVAVEISGVVFDATLAHGVASWSFKNFRSHYSTIETIELQTIEQGKALEFLKDQIGKPYDWTALLALPFRSGWQKSSRWFCSELFAAMLTAGMNRSLERALPAHRVTPRDAYIFTRIVQSVSG